MISGSIHSTMSQNTQGYGRRGGSQATGESVKAARQRMEAGFTDPPPRNPDRPTGSPNRAPISRPAPMPQWPLGNRTEISNQGRTITPSGNPRAVPILTNPPPRRPPRPSYVPSILDASRIQDHTPAFQYRQQQNYDTSDQQDMQNQKYWEDGNQTSPQEPRTPGNSGLSGTSISSRPSTTSSYGSIPDFPTPTNPSTQQRHYMPHNLPQSLNPPPLPQPQSRRSNNGPPPSARKGASSYYSHSSYVAPIPEELSESPRLKSRAQNHHHTSYASSNAIPQSWTDGPPAYYTYDDALDEFDEESLRDEGRSSRESDHDESTSLVRKASLGKQFKPTLTTVRSASSSESEESKASKNNKSIPITIGAAIASSIGRGESAGASASGQKPEGHEVYLSDQAYVEPQATNKDLVTTASQARSEPPLQPQNQEEYDPRVNQIMGSLEKSGAINKDVAAPPVTPTRRALKIDMDAVHKAEARGSLTSLSDLIRRATKVRTNLDRGRTASRLGMLEFGSHSNPNLLLEKKMAMNPNRGSDSLSGMIDCFPAPNGTPQGERPTSSWPSPFMNSNPNLAGKNEDPRHGSKKQGRRCCGLPLWAFLMLLALLILLIAAAVVIPIVLIVLARMRDDNAAATVLDLSNCAETNPCQNSGIPVVSNDSCRCICTGGFTGSSCAQQQQRDCTTSNAGGIEDATMGSSISRLLESANGNFSIPLNATSILSSFAASNLSCSDEQALVSFNGRTERRAVIYPVDADPVDVLPTPTAVHAVLARNPQDSIVNAITSNGVLLDLTAETPVPTALTVDGTEATSTSDATTSSTATSEPDSGTLDFARVAILWILQETQDIGTTIDVQQELRRKFSTSFVAESVNAGNGITVDFLRQRVSVNETTVGS